ncbi:hypothetical protein Pint_16095 [Pistacia integerrima]|uniref:Uncharacterized protein n=1 Tax=Pistacia integerrima TaxID=434235 RepID=A0ACC0ZCN7_9ROSI|nr:hypothetical protein Pint_16095 [Pistacia integerrima]
MIYVMLGTTSLETTREMLMEEFGVNLTGSWLMRNEVWVFPLLMLPSFLQVCQTIALWCLIVGCPSKVGKPSLNSLIVGRSMKPFSLW